MLLAAAPCSFFVLMLARLFADGLFIHIYAAAPAPDA